MALDNLYIRNLKKSEASIQDWGILDIPAAIDSLLNKTQQQKVILIGHSAGGQLLGITPNFQKVARLIAICRFNRSC